MRSACACWGGNREPGTIPGMHVVAVLALERVSPFDLAIPCEVFARVRLPDGRAPYEVRVCGVAKTVDAGAFEVRTAWGLRDLARADTVIVPGVADPALPVARTLVTAIRTAARNGVRIASICSGAFVLAAAGLLDGLRAIKH